MCDSDTDALTTFVPFIFNRFTLDPVRSVEPSPDFDWNQFYKEVQEFKDLLEDKTATLLFGSVVN